MYFVTGTLPWQGLRAATKQQKYESKFASKSKVLTLREINFLTLI